MRREPWFFDHEKNIGGVCPDCGGPVYRYCPGCGADMQDKPHIRVSGPPEVCPNPLTVCIDCAREMRALSERADHIKARMN